MNCNWAIDRFAAAVEFKLPNYQIAQLLNDRLNPLALIAELTHRCPLHCVYCSNPLRIGRGRRSELSTADWIERLPAGRQAGHAARALHRRRTAGAPRSDRTHRRRARRGTLHQPDHFRPRPQRDSACRRWSTPGSITSSSAFRIRAKDPANWIAGAKAHAHKIELSRAIRRHKIAFTVNLVVHRQNLDHLEEMIAFIEQLAPDRMEIAHTQYYGWALKNRAALLPTRAQLEKAVEIVAAAEQRLPGACASIRWFPTTTRAIPRPAWAAGDDRLMLINPAGKVLPCHAAEVIPGLAIRQCSRTDSGVDLAGVFVVPAFSRRRLDARTLPQLRPPHRRLRRMPLPGLPAYAGCDRHRSRVLAGAGALHRRSRTARGE